MDLGRYRRRVAALDPVTVSGRVVKVVGLIIEGEGPQASVGELCYVHNNNDGTAPVMAQVVGFRDSRVLLMPLGDMYGICPGSRITATGKPFRVDVGPSLLGRVLDGLGRPIDSRGELECDLKYPAQNSSPNPLERRRINKVLSTGIKAIDTMITCGMGQRMGIFAGSGVGKSVLLGMIARNTNADVNVIALVGERGRELREFIERDLGPEGLERSVVIAATSDRPALIRIQAAYVATSIAEYFREQGKNVLLMMDSVTRFAMAQREVGLAVGEPPATKGYTPSVFALLPQLMERAGTNAGPGSITALYTVLVEGDDMNEPIADATRSILDGHIVLSRRLAHLNHYPAIDVLESISRVMVDIVNPEDRNRALRLREVLATYRESEDMINIGAYVKGSNKKIDFAISMMERVNAFLRQTISDKSSFIEAHNMLKTIFPDSPPKAAKAQKIQKAPKKPKAPAK